MKKISNNDTDPAFISSLDWWIVCYYSYDMAIVWELRSFVFLMFKLLLKIYINAYMLKVFVKYWFVLSSICWQFQQKLSKSHVVHCWNRYVIYSTYHCSLGCFLMNLNLLRLFLYVKQVMLRSSQTTGRYQYYQFSQKSLNDSCIIVY